PARGTDRRAQDPGPPGGALPQYFLASAPNRGAVVSLALDGCANRSRTNPAWQGRGGPGRRGTLERADRSLDTADSGGGGAAGFARGRSKGRRRLATAPDCARNARARRGARQGADCGT